MKNESFILVLISLLVVTSMEVSSQYTSTQIIKDSVMLDDAISRAYQTIRTQSDSISLDSIEIIQRSLLMVEDTFSFIKFTRQVAINYYAFHDLNEEAIVYLKESENMLEGKEFSLDELYNTIGNFYYRLNYNTKALDYYLKSLQWHELYDPPNATYPLGNIASVYIKNRNFEKALTYSKKALNLSLQMEESQDKVSSLTYDYLGIGEIYRNLSNTSQATAFFEKGLKVSMADTIGYDRLNALYKALEFYTETGNNDSCKELILKGDKLCENSKICQSRNGHLFELKKSQYYISIGELEQAVEPDQMESRHLSNRADIYEYAVSYYKEIGNSTKTIENYDKMLEYTKQNIIEDRALSFSSLEEKYKNIKLAKTNQELLLQNEGRKRIIYIILIGMILSLSLLTLQLLNNKRHRRLIAELNFKKLDLENVNKNLTASNEELERFVFIASHDLKTPLINIVSFSELLESELIQSTNPTVLDYLSIIKDDGLRLQNLISDTLEYSKYSNNKFQLNKENINFSNLIHIVEESMVTILEERNATIRRLDHSPTLYSHKHSILILLKNLIENGIKYNRAKNPTVTIETEVNRGQYSITVSDNGIGIPEAYRENIFSMFYRLHNNSEYQGSGLGLSICHKIVSRLNGTIQIEGNDDGGSTFKVRIPMENV